MKTRRMTVVAVISVALMMLVMAESAMALPLNVRPAADVTEGELAGLKSALAAPSGVYSTWDLDPINDQIEAALFMPSESGLTTSTFLLLLELSIGGENAFGIYADHDPNVKLEVFSGGAAPTVSQSITFSGGNVNIGGDGGTTIEGFGIGFGFYLYTGTETFYSEDDKNPGGLAQMLIYEHPAGPYEYVIAMEESKRFEGTADNDFDDMVVRASKIQPIPETSSILLWCVVGGVFSLGCWCRRKREMPR